jgi:sulfatase maturation enzyme AslB (radical SAM superfamily)
MSLDKVFCTVPWFEIHINADGTYHTCGAQPNSMSGSTDAHMYNVHTMNPQDWVNSSYQRKTRLDKLNGIPNTLCNLCYKEDELYNNSKRVRENLKVGIHPINFHKSYIRSKHYNDFVNSSVTGENHLRPTSYHISLGNECNLACKMCYPAASSKVAFREFNAGTYSGPIRMNWTDDDVAWDNVVSYICDTENLEYVHVIGGEPVINPKFEALIDRLIAAGRTDIYLGFTTNGTIFNQNLLSKLNQFRHVDIGISIECMGELNDLIRHGSNTQTVLDNIDAYLTHRRQNHVYVTARIVPSALSIHTIKELFEWCVSRKLDVMSNILVNPPHLQIQQLPDDVKHRLLEHFSSWHHSDPAPALSNPRDPTWFKQHIDNEIMAITKALQLPNNQALTKELYSKLDAWKWLENPQIAKYFNTSYKA